jgi:hypothetical protein
MAAAKTSSVMAAWHGGGGGANGGMAQAWRITSISEACINRNSEISANGMKISE